MQVQGLALNLRLRGMHEAADLGVRLAQANRRVIWRLFLPLWLALGAAALSYPGSGNWLPFLVLFCAKPWVDRVLLFGYARAVFGESVDWRSLWAARRQVLFGQWLATLTLRRLSPWRAYTQPIHQLEGQRGKARRQRRALLLRGQRGAASMMQLAFVHAETVLVIAPLSLLLWLQPRGQGGDLLNWLMTSSQAQPLTMLAYIAAVALLEPYYVAAGFAMYLNRRVELEAWDIEQELRHVFTR